MSCRAVVATAASTVPNSLQSVLEVFGNIEITLGTRAADDVVHLGGRKLLTSTCHRARPDGLVFWPVLIFFDPVGEPPSTAIRSQQAAEDPH